MEAYIILSLSVGIFLACSVFWKKKSEILRLNKLKRQGISFVIWIITFESWFIMVTKVTSLVVAIKIYNFKDDKKGRKLA